nr:hypothetical protein [Tanacetum cinerariifolium]
MDQQNPTLAKIPILDTGKFEQWQFRIQQYLQHEHYALWEVIKFGDSYEAPGDVTTTGSASDETRKKKGRTVTLTTDDMQKRKNDVKARTTLLLSLPDEHQLRFSKYKTAQELWAAILKTFSCNEATKKTKKNLLKQQYGNFKMEGLKTLEQTFNRLQVIVSQLQFMDVEIEHDDRNQKFLTSLAPERLMHMIVWRNMSDLDTMSLDDLYNHLKSYMENNKENHALVADEEAPKEFALMAKTNAESEVFDNSLCFKAWLAQVEARLAEHRNQELKYYEKIRVLEFKTESKANCIESLTKDLELLKKEKGYSAVPPPPTQVYSPPKKDMYWTGLPEFKDDTVTDYSRPSPAIESTSDNAQNRNPSITETEASPSTISPKPFIKFMKATDRGNQRNWNNLKSHQLGANFVMKKRACYNCGDFDHLTYDCSKRGSSQNNIVDKGYWDSGCSRHMKGNISYLSEYEPFDGGYVSFGQGGCKITGKGTIKIGKLEFENVYFMKDLKTPRQHNKYSSDLNNIIPHKDLTCLVAKASVDEGMIWHRRLGYLNFKTMNRLVRYNLVRGLPSKCFENDHNCTACLKGKQHKASLTDDFSRFTWAFFLKTKDETSGILRKFITEIENLKDLKVKIIRTPAIGFLKPFGYHVMILNTLYNLGKFEAKGDKGTNSTNFLGTKDATRQEVKKDVSSLRYIALPNWIHEVHLESSSSQPKETCNFDEPESSGNSNPTATSTNPPTDQLETLTVETPIPTVSSPVSTACLNDSPEPLNESNGVEADVSNIETTITASPTPILRIHKDHPKSQIIGPVDTPIQTRHKSKEVGEQSFIATIHQKTDPSLLQFCLFSCFLSQVEPKKISDALQDPSWVEAMQEELLQFKIQNEERIDYDEVFAPVVRIEAIRLFLAYASFMRFIVYQIDVKSVFLYGTIDEEVYVMQPPGFQDPEFPAKVYKVEKAIGNFILVQVYVDDIIFGSSNPQLCREFKALMHEKFQMSAMGELNFFLGLQVLQKEDGIFFSQDKYVGDILKKFRYSDVRSSNTPMDKENPWGKEGTGKDVDLNLYRSMIGSLMYLTASRLDIMFAVCACARYQVTPKECHMHAVKRIFRYLRGRSKLGLWYPKEFPFDLVAYSDSDYGEYVAAASCCGQVPWIQNLLLDYGLGMPCEALSKEISSSILLFLRLIPLVSKEAMQEELLQFKLLNVWTLVDLPHGKRAIRTKWVYRNKRDHRGIVVRNKARLVAQGHRQEGIDYNEVYAPVAKIEAIKLFLDYESFMDFTVYQMDVKSAFLYGTIKEEVYVSQPLVFVDPEFPDREYKVEKALYGLHQAPRA